MVSLDVSGRSISEDGAERSRSSVRRDVERPCSPAVLSRLRFTCYPRRLCRQHFHRLTSRRRASVVALRYSRLTVLNLPLRRREEERQRLVV
jgi:hypothetical protein